MNGIDANTGKALSGIDHLRQSVVDILSTPVGSRVMRRDYGSRLHELVDAPMNRATILEIYAATAEALARWEPRIEVREVRLNEAAPGRLSLALSGVYIPEGREVRLDDIEVR
ncbi:GPW/gp25 family protein [Limimaricola variabilis]|uniref:GPW/gp25 family protein n=1 Tax=Limimaricola variabilis TaxID=1492771 RepID=UPI002AC9BF75|nr:GPW/gp25 family protein [Limimaricola variabilis]WPY95598.1 GPW/gp25 family protein [Limimaricola variabilis]